MSNAGRGQPNQPTGGNGRFEQMQIPPDLVWDEDNTIHIYNCSQHTTHHPSCDHKNCDPVALDSESQVAIINEGKAWARAGMNFHGVPLAYDGVIPVPGIRVELLDLMMWLEVTKDALIELAGITPFEFEEKFREKKLEFLRQVREHNEESIRLQRIKASMSVVQKPSIIGPDGNPF